MGDDGFEILLSEEAIAQRVDELAQRISRDYADRRPLVLIGILKGAFIFLADLARRVKLDHSIEFMAVSSYGKDSVSTGAVRLMMDVRESIEGKHVVVVEDIVDSGYTLQYLISHLQAQNPASLRTCALVRKPGCAKTNIALDYLGFDIPDKWVVGYGLDYAERHRTLPFIAAIEPAADSV